MNLTDFPISDKNTQNLMNGLLLLLKTYPSSKVEIFNERNVAIEVGNEYKLITEQVFNLLSWGWIHDCSRSFDDFDGTTIHWWYFEVENREEE